MNNQDYKAMYYINRVVENSEASDYEITNWCRKVKFMIHKDDNDDNDKKDICQVVKSKIKELAQKYDKTQKTMEEKNIDTLGKMFKLSDLEKDILSVLYLPHSNRLFREFKRQVQGYSSNINIRNLSAMLDKFLIKYVSRKSKLAKLGFIDADSCEVGLTLYLVDLISNKIKTEKQYIDILLGKSLTGGLTAKDFSYMPELDFALKIIKSSAKEGINILLYGKPGTGKTEFAKMLAGESKKNLYTIGENNDGENTDNFRLKSLYRNLQVASKSKNTCLLFDEAEDIFSGLRTKINKVEMNRLLEENKCPIIWCTNNIKNMDPAYIRRFTLAIPFQTPPLQVRESMWNKYLQDSKIIAAKQDISNLAEDYNVPPSIISGAVKATKMVKGNIETVKQHINLMRQALNNGHKQIVEHKKDIVFCADLVNSDLDLEQLKNRLLKLGKLNFSLCLYGASGTGKSFYARYLAETLKIKYCQKRASDLISPFVGGTEHNIARAFEQAKEENYMLIFDEADSFLQNRSKAHYAWEKTAVNEMLTWMESHPYPFICTTNLMNDIDPASLRRFTFKVKYDFLTSTQVKIAFDFFFGLKVNEGEIIHLNKLTPADFTVIKNKAEIFGLKNQPARLIEMLSEEQKLKTPQTTANIGFCMK